MSHKNIDYTNIIYDVVPKIIQTDNGTEFANTKVVQCDEIRRYQTILREVKTYQSKVETSH